MNTHNAPQADIDMAMGMFDTLEEVEAQLAEWARDHDAEVAYNTREYAEEMIRNS